MVPPRYQIAPPWVGRLFVTYSYLDQLCFDQFKVDTQRMAKSYRLGVRTRVRISSLSCGFLKEPRVEC